ncbi:hypothetical protein JN531_016385 [Flagellatimonas centrodinii]|uniref:hypothetical protein n=1 Tax=Flagellatimonas centrodinii TaxID=2806210 RepID=UPI001FEDE85A|nr:hypothetical protein [Flagellatimonas centrodinii]ULQ46660.1 hypothetical protein JN531_016385 [Flagellatimonas centrodinii]
MMGHVFVSQPRSLRPRLSWLAATLALQATLVGCGSSSPVTAPDGGATGGEPTPSALGRYDLFNQCWVMRADGDYVVREGDGFVARDASVDEAERFYMRAANLGRYLFYTPDEMLLTADGAAVATVPQTAPEDGSDWTFTESGDALNAATLGGVLAVGEGGRLALGSTPAALRFEHAVGCAEYPEMPLAVIGETFKGKLGAPALGFAEVHTHMAMGSEMSDGSGDVGPSAGGVMYGQAVNRFGVTEALKDCSMLHGPNGILDPEALILDMTPGTTHDTQGWPSFVDWPFHDSQLHQQMYWRWVERAWMSGLRLMTIHGTNIEALCRVAQLIGPTRGQNPADLICEDMPVGVAQVEYLYEIQDYIDAQFGGPGKGFYRIVKSPSEARQVIADGKLAVIPGLEFSNIFGCNVTFLPDGSEIPQCDRAQIDAEIDRIWDLGVRQVFPYHDIDSALGGAGLFQNFLEIFNFVGTGRFWETYACPDGGEGETYFYNAGLNSLAEPLGLGNDPLTDFLLGLTGGLTPTLNSGRRCNQRDVTDLGIYAIDKMMKKGFVIDIDHAELRSKQIMLDHTGTTTPTYPMVSGHGAQGGLTNAQAQQLIAQGGIIYPINQNGKGHVDFLARLDEQWTLSGTDRPLSAGYGADANGLRNLPGARGMARIMETGPVSYPFQMFQGEDWGPQFEGVAPITVEQLAVPGAEGRIWDVNESGMFHYGMIADIVEEIRLEGGQAALDTLYNSAETYLQMWERTLEASADARTRPVPETVPR